MFVLPFGLHDELSGGPPEGTWAQEIPVTTLPDVTSVSGVARSSLHNILKTLTVSSGKYETADYDLRRVLRSILDSYFT